MSFNTLKVFETATAFRIVSAYSRYDTHVDVFFMKSTYVFNSDTYSRYRCAPVKYEYYYTVRNGETLLVRRRVGETRRQRTEDSSSLEMNVASGHRSRNHQSSNQRRHKKTGQSGSSSHQRSSHHQSRSGRSTGYGGGSHRSDGK